MLKNTDVNEYYCCTFNGCALVVRMLIQTFHSHPTKNVIFRYKDQLVNVAFCLLQETYGAHQCILWTNSRVVSSDLVV
jgi:hypothetical protein